jgi:hypothetical protein
MILLNPRILKSQTLTRIRKRNNKRSRRRLKISKKRLKNNKKESKKRIINLVKMECQMKL